MNTNILQKISPSIINAVFTLFLTIIFINIFNINFDIRIIWITIFFVYNILCELYFDRCLGMIIFQTRYGEKRSFLQKLIYSFLYTISFSSLLFYLWIPFDLFIINMLLIQLSCVYFTGTTLHGFLSGGITTVKMGKG